MKKRRVIPIIILRNGEIVQSYEFEKYKIMGNALKAVERFSNWDADEIIYIDITPHSTKSSPRHDLNTATVSNRTQLIEQVSKRSTMPFTFGGGLRSLQDIELAIYSGADKVSINTLLLENKNLVRQAIHNLGSQAIVASVDYANLDGQKKVWNSTTRSFMNLEVVEWIKEIEQLGVGEILLTDIKRDGIKLGYDLATIGEASSAVSVPVIANGGVGSWSHLREGLEAGADAVAAANIFHFFDQSVYLARKFLHDSELLVRAPSLDRVL